MYAQKFSIYSHKDTLPLLVRRWDNVAFAEQSAAGSWEQEGQYIQLRHQICIIPIAGLTMDVFVPRKKILFDDQYSRNLFGMML